MLVNEFPIRPIYVRKTNARFFFKYPQNPSESNVCVDVYLLSSPAEPTQHTVIWSFEGVIRFWWYPSFAPTPKVSCFSEQNQTKYPAVGKVWHVAEQWSASFAPAPPLHPWEGLERAVSFPWLRMVVPWFPSSWSDQSKIDFNICNSAPFERWAPRLL